MHIGQYKYLLLTSIFFCSVGVSLYHFAGSLTLNGLQEACISEEGGSCRTSFYLEIAESPEERAKGLMFRDTLGEDRGMLFVFPEEQEVAMWMKDTRISLDMLFLDRNKKIIGIIENVPPFSLDRREIKSVSKYVLEIAGGVVAKKNIKKGHILVFK